MGKDLVVTLVVILAVILLAIVLLVVPKGKPNNPGNQTNVSELEKVAACLGQRAELYVQLGCHACEIQGEMFGEYVENLTIVDCFYEREKCVEIEATPTWKIGGNYYKGVQPVDRLLNWTGCLGEVD